MGRHIDLDPLYTSSDLYDGLLRFGRKDSLRNKCYFPPVNAAAWINPQVKAPVAGAVISIANLFGETQDVTSDLVDREMTIHLDWAKRWFPGSALSLLTFYHAAPVAAADVTGPVSGQLPADAPMVCDEPDMQLLVAPLRPHWARQNGSPRTVLFDEQVAAMAAAHFGPENRATHLEALTASLIEHLEAIADGRHTYDPLPDRLMVAIRQRVVELKATAPERLALNDAPTTN